MNERQPTKDNTQIGLELRALIGIKKQINENLYKKGIITRTMYSGMKDYLNSKEALKRNYLKI
ncbi:hypothetical protein [Anaerovorax sp. IOR16]|uniref:hypothetical protein n=1 Tax=Anaerovorax sp. IOR16 TaxID=2773458 RepID=UPI0019D2CE83|nr:hypothetical protein [Anaerovorax sp. IOR16]